MEPSASIQRRQAPASQDDDGLWMKMDSKLVTENTDMPNHILSSLPGQSLQDEPKAPTPAVIENNVVDNDSAAHIFIPLQTPPSYRDPLFPARSNKDSTSCNSSVTPVDEAGDDTGDKANYNRLHWHPSERQSMAQREVVEVSADAAQISGEYKDPTPNAEDQRSKGGQSLKDPFGGTREQDQPDDVLSEGKENLGEADKDTFLSRSSSNTGDNFQNDALLEKVGGLIRKDKAHTYTQSCNTTPEIWKTNRKPDAENSRAQTQSQTGTSDDVENRNTRYLRDSNSNISLVKSVRDTCGVQMSEKPFGKALLPQLQQKQNMEGRVNQGDECWRITSDIEQGEQLLQRLQLLQQRQEADVCACKDVGGEMEDREKFLAEEDYLAAKAGDRTGENEKDGMKFDTNKSDRTRTSLIEKEKKDGHGSRDAQANIPAQLERNDDSPSVSWVNADWSPNYFNEAISKPTSLPSTCHRLSVTETSMERRIHQDAEGKQNLQRAGGVLNLADDPDVLEIPFNTNILFETLSTEVCPGQDDDWRLSEQKTTQEMSPKAQRELGMTGFGKISKEHIKGEAHQLKETKLLFESFQQDNTQGPTRIKKPLSASMTDQGYPSVLERTRSLEMFSVKSSPISRAHSSRIYKTAISDKQKSWENLPSKSPTGGSRDRLRLSPYGKQDKNVHLHRSSESISTDVTTPAVESVSSAKEEKTTQESPVIKQNPFVKLRPSLALQPEVEKDIREAEAREDELRRQRRTLYGETLQSTKKGNKLLLTSAVIPGGKQPSRGKLDRVWPPPSKTEQLKSEQTQSVSVHRAGSQRSGLWQRWETGRINGQMTEEKN
ncbi:uncharacterized protein LOC129171728 [Dunckerocampus dactyliophorus]|uniref:uncharacterized protein LOC129171728 n=1 Tax=Dunckerocampus dactyliophorus TaxID=161453 RepID=UPI002406D9E3|nr:uncharacterized protein LOC129171728 [Dunckerocampus dactyliophorus]XP_054616646.1 uncharacterized protein LOC129171728 [Dunckerocampus dactyliophorus]XP_054616647.1 uncharacterized protein LOC129171728 [Dunckerocampus dactyliophorus]XP_054616648.1 uncharacterized protein LOC129171728 [Dunckerocampus dactyliophorus]